MAYQESTGVGLRQAYIAQRDDDGTIKVLGSPAAGTAYAGIRAARARALTVTPADPQRIYARGDDVTYAVFQESPTETPSGELRTQQSDTALIALITDVVDFGSGNMSQVPLASNKLGTEDPMIIWGSRKAIDSSTSGLGTRVWETYILLSCAMFAKPPTFEDSQIGEFVWSISLNASTVDHFGRTFSIATHGCTEAAYVMVKTRYKFFMDAFDGDASETEFTLTKGTSTIYSTATSPVMAFVDGVQVTPSSVSSAGVVTLSSPPASGAAVVIQYEYND